MTNESTLEIKSKEKDIKKYVESHPNRWAIRMLLEPFYAIRSLRQISKSSYRVPKDFVKQQMPIAVTLDVAKLGTYGYAAYEIVKNCF